VHQSGSDSGAPCIRLDADRADAGTEHVVDVAPGSAVVANDSPLDLDDPGQSRNPTVAAPQVIEKTCLGEL